MGDNDSGLRDASHVAERKAGEEEASHSHMLPDNGIISRAQQHVSDSSPEHIRPAIGEWEASSVGLMELNDMNAQLRQGQVSGASEAETDEDEEEECAEDDVRPCSMP